MLAEIKGMDGFTADLEQKLTALKPEPVTAAPAAAATAAAPQPAETAETPIQVGLFDIKILNDIEDIKTRASLKKIYMGAKKASKNTPDVVPEMISELESQGLLTDDVKNLLEGTLK